MPPTLPMSRPSHPLTPGELRPHTSRLRRSVLAQLEVRQAAPRSVGPPLLDTWGRRARGEGGGGMRRCKESRGVNHPKDMGEGWKVSFATVHR